MTSKQHICFHFIILIGFLYISKPPAVTLRRQFLLLTPGSPVLYLPSTCAHLSQSPCTTSVCPFHGGHLAPHTPSFGHYFLSLYSELRTFPISLTKFSVSSSLLRHRSTRKYQLLSCSKTGLHEIIRGFFHISSHFRLSFSSQPHHPTLLIIAPPTQVYTKFHVLSMVLYPWRVCESRSVLYDFSHTENFTYTLLHPKFQVIMGLS